jgi:hypothetical protein
MFEKYFNYKEEQYLFCTLNEKYLKDTALLLNSEWPRSMHQRDSGLKSLISNVNEKLNLPVSLVLVLKQKTDNHDESDKLIGHLSIVPICASLDIGKNDQTGHLPFIQSVIIDKNYRGKGFL